MKLESRFQTTENHDPERYGALVARARLQIAKRIALYAELARSTFATPGADRIGPGAV